MKAVITLFIGVVTAISALAADARFVVNDPFAGYYKGTFKTRLSGGPAEAQIRSLGNGTYDGFVVLRTVKDGVESIMTAGIINEFTPGEEKKANFAAVHPNSLERYRDSGDPRLAFPALTLSGEVTPGHVAGKISGAWFRPDEATFELTRAKAPASATLGAPAPKGATIIFDGKDHDQWKEAKWKIQEGALEVGEGNITTKQTLTNFLLHLEFRTPHMPAARGQARGNSGVYLRSVFEVQVLDSFGLFPLADNDCGGIYKVQAPDLNLINASLPPGEWQTYDITYREGDQKTQRMPEITVVHNGKAVIKQAKVASELVVNGTGGGEVDGGFLMLQNHGNPVQYRNIWAQPIE